ncbi:tetratricopeptide repeat-containing diguanylate cyclase [Dokdonella sp.]|uniref:tetratricopeptide repeat-containing diguanylate cyclase n=1 Tax=Dokdonella sp. TaxID=2291710 RepID=UPI0025C28CB1|nr:tetratricopeptide repeat-containing diguanylate cyclase [Dokdonella sp.]MBX3688436.1 GGDEF domain-containing protein [Dokdonella sp.]
MSQTPPGWLIPLLALLLSAHSEASDPLPRAAPAALDEAAQFDAMFKRLEGGDLLTLSVPRARAAVRQLQALLPADDGDRQRLIETLNCTLDYGNAYAQGLEFAQRQFSAALTARDHRAAARFLYCRASYEDILEGSTIAMASLERGIMLARTSGDDAALALGLQARGNSESVLGSYGKALADSIEARRLLTQLGMDEAANRTLQDIGITYRRLGDQGKAREYLEQAIAHQQEVGDRASLFVSVLNLGYSEQEDGSHEEALNTLERALGLAANTDIRSDVAASRLALGSVLVDLKRNREALEALQKAADEYAQLEHATGSGMIAFERGRAFAGLGQLRKAIDQYSVAQTVFERNANTRYQERLYLEQARAFESADLPVAALGAYRKYLAAHDRNVTERNDQRAQVLREQFESDRARLENQRLKDDKATQERQLEVLERARHWQRVALVLLATLLIALAVLALRQLARLRSLKRAASIDPLTEVLNLRGLKQAGQSALREARSDGETLSVLAIDIDHFKRINDRFGHPVGDRVLRAIANTCAQALREGDLLGRSGGEEFLAVLPGAQLVAAHEVAERLRESTANRQFDDLGPGEGVTLSIGVAELEAQDRDMAALVARADTALYRAKALGRNRVEEASAYERGGDAAPP